MATKASRSSARLMISPAVILLLGWMIIPLAMTIYFSFLRYNLFSRARPRSRDGKTTTGSSPTRASGRRCATRWSWSAVCSPSRRWRHLLCALAGPPDVRPRHHPHHGHRAVFRHADRVGSGLEEHVHEPGERHLRPASPSGLGLQPIDFFGQIPDGIDHFHRVLDVASVRDADPAYRDCNRSTRNSSKPPKWTAQAGSTGSGSSCCRTWRGRSLW